MKGYRVIEQPGRICGRITKWLREKNWKISGPKTEESMFPDDVDDNIAPKVRIYSYKDGNVNILIPDQVTDEIDLEGFVTDDSFIQLLKDRAHSTKSETIDEISEMLNSAQVRNPDIMNLLETASTTNNMFAGYICTSITISRKEKKHDNKMDEKKQ